MSETRTVRQGLIDAGVGGKTIEWLETLQDAALILDALIGCQGRVVYTEEDVEAMGKAISQELGMMVQRGIPEAEGFPLIARAAITAAGGVVADEVVEGIAEVEANEDDAGPVWVLRRAGRDAWQHSLRPDDTLYIVRAKEEGLPPDYPPPPDVAGLPDVTTGDNDEGL